MVWTTGGPADSRLRILLLGHMCLSYIMPDLAWWVATTVSRYSSEPPLSTKMQPRGEKSATVPRGVNLIEPKTGRATPSYRRPINAGLPLPSTHDCKSKKKNLGSGAFFALQLF